MSPGVVSPRARCLRALFAGLVVALVLPLAAMAAGEQSRTVSPALVEALGIPELLQIMREEGQDYGAGIGAEFLPGGGGESWAATVERIYDAGKMRASVEAGLAAGIAPGQEADLVTFFQSETGRRIVAQEIAARRAFLDPDTEETARQAYVAAEAVAAAGEDPEQARRLELLEAYMAANDLVEFNLAGALTANLRFYRGLAEGGAVEMTEEDMLAEVWSQEEDIRIDTAEWLMAFLMMAYAPLSNEEIAKYVALSETSAGRALNQGLFAGFDAMYADLSYALGLAVAMEMRGEDL